MLPSSAMFTVDSLSLKKKSFITLRPGGQVGAEEGQDDVDDVWGLGVSLALLDELVHVRDEGVQRSDALLQPSGHLCKKSMKVSNFCRLSYLSDTYLSTKKTF